MQVTSLADPKDLDRQILARIFFSGFADIAQCSCCSYIFSYISGRVESVKEMVPGKVGEFLLNNS